MLKPDTTYRRPTDVAALLIGTVILLGSAITLFVTQGAMENATSLLRTAVDTLPDSVETLLKVILYAGSYVAIPVTVGVALLTRRWVLARNLALSGGAAWLVAKAVNALVEQGRPLERVYEALLQSNAAVEVGFPSAHVAIASALLTVASPYLSFRSRWIGWLVVALVAMARLVTGAQFLLDILAGLAIGLVIGAITNLLFGVPKDELSLEPVREAFAKNGIELTSLAPVQTEARGSAPFFATAADGSSYMIKLVGTQHRTADFLFKVWRAALLKKVASTMPFLTPKQQVEHEAYVTLLARNFGLRTPPVRFTTSLSNGFAMLAQQRIEGRNLAEIEPGRIDDNLLAKVWQQVRELHEARISHGELRLENIIVDPANQPWLIDFSLAEAGADAPLYSQDVAQLLASMASTVGAERAVATALDVLGAERVEQTAPYLQSLALSNTTQASLPADSTLLGELRDAIEQQTGAELPGDESLLRITPGSIVMIVGLGVGVYLLLPQVGELGQLVEILRAVSPLWLLLGFAAWMATNVAGTIAQRGAQDEAVPFWRTTVAHLASTFGSRVGPRGVGGAIVLGRYLEKSGLRRSMVLASITAKVVASTVVHLVTIFLVLAIINTDRLDLEPFGGIQPWQVGVAAAAIVLTGALVASRSPDRVRATYHSIRNSVEEFASVLRQPIKAIELLGGTAGSMLLYMLTLSTSLWAVGIEMSPFAVAAVYLIGEIIGSASPTPGGIGVVEGTYVAAFRLFGVSSEPAIAATLLYRMLTFWLPILPGFIAFRYLQRQKHL